MAPPAASRQIGKSFVAPHNRRKGLTFYSLRHSMATHFLEHGSPADLQALLGHASLSTSMRYVRAVSDRARAGIEALGVGA